MSQLRDLIILNNLTGIWVYTSFCPSSTTILMHLKENLVIGNVIELNTVTEHDLQKKIVL